MGDFSKDIQVCKADIRIVFACVFYLEIFLIFYFSFVFPAPPPPLKW